MKVFLTGSTGYVGNYILRALIDHGYSVKCLVRQATEKKLRIKDACEICHGDILDYDSLLPAMLGCDAVINLVGIIREFPARGITFTNLHYIATQNCIDAAQELGIDRFVQMSALGTRENARSMYHKTKYMAEEYVIKSGLTYTIFRPSLIFGKQDMSINLFAEKINKLPVFPVFGNGRYRLQPVSVENVAEGFAKAIESKQAFNKIFEIGGPKKYEFNELLDAIGKTLGKRVWKLHIPLFVTKPLLWLIGRFSFSPITYEQLTMLLEDSVCDERQFYKTFKIEPIPLEEGIKRYIQTKRQVKNKKEPDRWTTRKSWSLVVG
ncbi:MAG: complex I NDUFA9 subunit family protein [Sedimentisphaerales bacterium]